MKVVGNPQALWAALMDFQKILSFLNRNRHGAGHAALEVSEMGLIVREGGKEGYGMGLESPLTPEFGVKLEFIYEKLVYGRLGFIAFV